MRKISKEEKLDYARRFRQARSQGVMTKDFCDENRLSSSMLSRYLKLADQDGCGSSQANQPFVRVPVPVSGGHRPVGEGSAVAVELKGVSIKLGPGYSARQLEHILALVGVSHAV
jgi:hypothetical protein